MQFIINFCVQCLSLTILSPVLMVGSLSTLAGCVMGLWTVWMPLMSATAVSFELAVGQQDYCITINSNRSF